MSEYCSPCANALKKELDKLCKDNKCRNMVDVAIKNFLSGNTNPKQFIFELKKVFGDDFVLGKTEKVR
ncbi:MAG: hypothetical protein ACTSUF_03470 [Candidatus Heimdallarchaeaceae archaeon]